MSLPGVFLSCLVASVTFTAGSHIYELDASAKTLLVDAHNTFRSMVANGTAQPPQPTARYILAVSYNDSIGEGATELAAQCDFRHQAPSNKHGFEWIGQNLYAEWYGEQVQLDGNALLQLLKRAVDGWYSEIVNFRYPGCIEGQICGHFTQVIDADTRFVGCAVSYCATLLTLDVMHAFFVVCNYAPGGNIIGKPPYIAGELHCPADFPNATKYGLCEKG